MRATWPKQYEKGPLTVRALTSSLRIHRSKGNTTLHFSHFKVIDIAMQHFKE